MKHRSRYLEIILHLLLWLLYFSAINVDWSAPWFDPSLRPTTPPPLSALLFPVLCYANAFWLIPKYFNRKQWHYYLGFGFLVFILPELIRAWLVSSFNPALSFTAELESRDSLIFGAPGILFIALNLSFGYRFTRDWFKNQRKPQNMEQIPAPAHSTTSPKTELLLSEAEASQLLQQLQTVIQQHQPHLNPDLNLRDLSMLVNTTDKKLSSLFNQHLASNFYDYINILRIEAFKEKISQGASRQLSIAGIAAECGFKSKSSFYRAFKKHVGQSPSEYAAQQ